MPAMPQLFIDRVSPALQVNWALPTSNPFRVPLLPNGGDILDVSQFRKVHVLFGQTGVQSADLLIGKISGSTLAMRETVQPSSKIQTFVLNGPEMMLALLKPPGATGTERIQLWLFLTD
jgi:hypothetical protein